jgi:hypothetical protein
MRNPCTRSPRAEDDVPPIACEYHCATRSPSRRTVEPRPLRGPSFFGEVAAGTPGDEGGAGAPSGSSTSGPPDADTASTTTEAESTEAAGGEGDVADAPEATGGSSARADADAPTASTPVGSETVPSETPEPALELDASNDNQPMVELPATGTE